MPASANEFVCAPNAGAKVTTILASYVGIVATTCSTPEPPMSEHAEYALVACFPGCGWNGEVGLDEHRQWTCPGCGQQWTFRSHRGAPDE